MGDSMIGQVGVLIIGERSDLADALIERLGDFARVRHVASVEASAQLLAEESFDFILSDPLAFRTVSQLLDAMHAECATGAAVAPSRSLPITAEAVIEHVTHAIGIFDRTGIMVWANPRMRTMPAELHARIRALCLDAFSWAADAAGSQPRASTQNGRRYTVDHHEHTYEVHLTPVVDLDQQVTQVAAVVWDATRLRTLQVKLDAIDHAAEELVSLDSEHIETLDVQQRLDLLEQKVIRYSHELMHFDNFTVHLLDKKTMKLELVLSSGMPSQVNEIPLYASPQGNGVVGHVAAAGRSYLCGDVANDPRYIPGAEGAQSCLAVPLKLHDEVIGVFNVESRELATFTEDDRQFAEIFARHIAMALQILNLLVSERFRTTGQLSSDLAAEISGPLNDILTDVANLVDDYIGHDELRRRLNQISDNGVKIRDALRLVSTSERGLVDHQRSTATVKHDPLLAGRRILVVDDEEVIRETVSDVLRSYGVEIESAADGEAGIQLIKAHQFDLVISDIKMPRRSGYEIFAAAKERDGNCPVILMTGFGYDPNHSIVRARREGLAAVLFKPFKVDQLLGEIRTAIRAVQP